MKGSVTVRRRLGREMGVEDLPCTLPGGRVSVHEEYMGRPGPLARCRLVRTYHWFHRRRPRRMAGK